jgi:hypothetical protein
MGEHENNLINTESKENKEINNEKDSFEKVFHLQKLIHKQAGLKRLCKKK